MSYYYINTFFFAHTNCTLTVPECQTSVYGCSRWSLAQKRKSVFADLVRPLLPVYVQHCWSGPPEDGWHAEDAAQAEEQRRKRWGEPLFSRPWTKALLFTPDGPLVW